MPRGKTVWVHHVENYLRLLLQGHTLKEPLDGAQPAEDGPLQ